MEENNCNPIATALAQNATAVENVVEPKDEIPEDFNGDEINAKVDEIIANQTISNSDKLREIVWNTCLKLYKDGVEYDIADVVDTVKTYMAHSKIELLHDKVTLDNQKAAVEFVDSAIISSEGLAGASNSLQSLVDGSFFDDLMGEYTSDSDRAAVNEISSFATKIQLDENNEQIEIKQLQKELHQTVAISDIAYQLVMADYKAEHGDTSIYDDVLEKLYKDKDTLSKSTNVNAANRIKNIDAVIEALDENKRLELIDYVKPKLNNAKALREMAKELIKLGPKIYPKLGKVGITKDYVLEFLRFFLTEFDFRSIYNTGDIIMPDRSAISPACMMFFYHILKLVEHERQRGTYKSVIYKMIFIYVMDTSMRYPVNPKNCRPQRFVEQEGDPVTETELSLTRDKIYDAIMPVLKVYAEILNDKTLVDYSKAQARRLK